MTGNSLFTVIADATVSGTTEGSIVGTGYGDVNIPANFFYPGRCISIILRGYYSTSLIPGTLTVKAKLGSTLIGSGTSTAVLATSLVNKSFSVAYTLTCRSTGVSGSVIGEGDFRYMSGLGAISTDGIISTTATTIDTTISQLLDIRVIWSLTGQSVTVPVGLIQAWN